ncbi:hypothetical protein [Desulfocurvus sp. DL9XJH121]
MRHLTTLATACALSLVLAAAAFAHTPICSCFDEGDGTVTCEGGFSDGSSAAGVGIHVLDASGKSILDGKMNENSEFNFKKPGGDYTVMFDAGEGHQIRISGSDIVE